MTRAPAWAALLLALALTAPAGALLPFPPSTPAVDPTALASPGLQAAARVLGLAQHDSLAGFVRDALALHLGDLPLGPTPAPPSDLPEALARLHRAHAAAERALAADRPSAASALVGLARAVDDLLPLLPRTALLPGPCDALDLAPLLCVASDGPNLHSDPHAYAVLVDFGGDDLYLGRAAGAGPGEARVLVDLAGDDVYRAELSADGAAQGAGLGGAGILWDRAGDDSYACTAAGATRVACQGAGTHEGLGLLWDEGGNDVYQATVAPTPSQVGGATLGTPTVLLAAQGAAADVDNPAFTPDRYHYAVGVLADAGGHDAYQALARTGFDLAPPWEAAERGDVWLAAQGAGLFAAGALADLGGDDTYLAEAFGGRTSCAAQGAALFLAQGLLADGAGDDAYEARCGQWVAMEAPVGRHAILLLAALNAAQQGSAQYSLVRGVTSVPMSALLADLAGDDAYLAHAGQVAVANSTVRADARTQVQWLTLQGAGLEGEAELLDLAGDDAYTILAENVAEANSPQGEAQALARFTYLYGQGAAGYASGMLLDLGGRDAYVVQGVQDARITGAPLPPNPGGVLVQEMRIGVQGAGDQRLQSPDQQGVGLFLDADGNGPGDDLVVSTPYDPTCQPPVVPKELFLMPDPVKDLLRDLPRVPVGGARGSALWFDCDPGGVGLMV